VAVTKGVQWISEFQADRGNRESPGHCGSSFGLAEENARGNCASSCREVKRVQAEDERDLEQGQEVGIIFASWRLDDGKGFYKRQLLGLTV
jgi:hypothetical protein